MQIIDAGDKLAWLSKRSLAKALPELGPRAWHAAGLADRRDTHQITRD